MTRREALEALIARVEVGEIPGRHDFAIDAFRAEIAKAIGFVFEPRKKPFDKDIWRNKITGQGYFVGDLPGWEISIDAQAALPGQIINVCRRWNQRWVAYCILPNTTEEFSGHAPSEPAARLAAHLRAMMETINDLP